MKLHSSSPKSILNWLIWICLPVNKINLNFWQLIPPTVSQLWKMVIFQFGNQEQSCNTSATNVLLNQGLHLLLLKIVVKGSSEGSPFHFWNQSRKEAYPTEPDSKIEWRHLQSISNRSRYGSLWNLNDITTPKRGTRNNTGNRYWDSTQKCPIWPLIILQQIRVSDEIEHFDLDKKYLILSRFDKKMPNVATKNVLFRHPLPVLFLLPRFTCSFDLNI